MTSFAGDTGTADLLVISAPGFPSVMMMGPAGKALAAGPEAVTGNPAMIVSGFTAAGGTWNLQTTGISVAGGFSVGPDLSVSGGLTYLGRGGILRRDETGSVTGEYSFVSGTALAGVSFPLTSWLRGGVSAGISWENIAEEGGTGLTCSAGLRTDLQNGMKAGIAISGIGQAPSWNGIRKNMPAEVSAGVSYPFGSILTGFAGGRIGFSTSDTYGGGLRIEYADLALSAGYGYAPDEDEISGFFAGVQYSYISNGTYTIEAAVSQRDDLSWPVFAGISISL
ncbi:hypothetical protein DRQ25_05570 [Candidatus Fermentibacteria bacterium]|nr:MAG: hypothetical protein DRQ25_05570 [Candidatus Fermentibacteria bacterium]